MQSSKYALSILREKVRKDGYKWKKYGEEKVKNEHKRGYYKCTHSDCQTKKKFYWSDDGTNEYFNYTNQHNHPNPQLRFVPLVAHVFPIVEQGPHQPYLAGVEVQGDKYCLLAF
ncbi:putative transcription factor WRKY family [Medicago truncatula]|uniref:Putative transcription factor WRKY family n=1 Tax=Medicago truncatula TaxID=3880 RepID=A0A396I656_MEDTR|nr:putative transcription factor WRKY family [Medicago truncatula]